MNATRLVSSVRPVVVRMNTVMGRIDIITGTPVKHSVVRWGGFTAARKEVIDTLRQKIIVPICSLNTLAPSIAGASLAVLDRFV